MAAESISTDTLGAIARAARAKAADQAAAEAAERRQRRSERVLVLGLDLDGVESYLLGSQPDELNVAEYSTVIYYLGGYAAEAERWAVEDSGFRREAMERLTRSLEGGSTDRSWRVPPQNPVPPPRFDVDRRQLYRQMVSNEDRIAVFIGDPSVPERADRADWLATSLFPWFPEVTTDGVAVTRIVASEFERYLGLVARVPYTLGQRRRAINMEYATGEMVAASEGHDLRELKLNPLAYGRSGPTAIEVSAVLWSEDGAADGHLSLCWLPEPTKVTPEEAVATLLNDLCGMEIRTDTPSWADALRLGPEAPIRAELATLAAERQRLDLQDTQLRDKLADTRRFLPLLWSTGDELEILVRDAFRFLGAEVMDPVSRSEEDGIITDPDGGAWVLEVKGNEGPLKQSDVVAAHKHESEVVARTDGKFEGRTLLVVNAQRLIEPAHREREVHQNAKRIAARWSVSIVFTEMLLLAVAERQMGAFEADNFWNAIRSANVVAELPVEMPQVDGGP